MTNPFKSFLLDAGLYATRQTSTVQVRALIGKLKPQDCSRELIRVGPAADGGYLVPDDLEGIEYCFSPGVNTVCDFENDLADRGIRSFMADASVDGPPIVRPEFVFDKKFLGASERDPFMTLGRWKERYLPGYSGDLLLQMDIEGWEYEVLFNLPDALLNQFRIMVIEFHDLDRMFDPFSFKVISSCFEKILEHFHVAHIHPNNCSRSVKVHDLEIPPIMEFTFLNKRRVTSHRDSVTFPHPLDADNTANGRLKLPGCWYLQGDRVGEGEVRRKAPPKGIHLSS